MTITFNPPGTRLACKTEIALGADLTADPATWSWTDVTAYVRHAAGVDYQTGRADQWSNTDETAASLVFDNRDGRFSRHNPSGAYYGRLSKNTPLRSGFDAGEGTWYPVKQFVTEWPNRWDISRVDKTTKIKTAGVRRRLAQGAVVKSPLRRTWDAALPTAYWPIEEGSDAKTIASVVANGPPLRLRGAVALGETLPTLGSAGAADVSATGAAVFGSTGIPSIPVASWEVEVTIGWETLPALDFTKMYPIMTLKTPGSAIEQWYVFLRSINPFGTYGFSVWYLTAGTIQEVVTIAPPLVNGQPVSFRLALTQNGANIDVTVDPNGPGGTSTAATAATLYAPTYFEASSTFYTDAIGGIPGGFAGGWQDLTHGPTSLSHLAFLTPKRAAPVTYKIANGFVGETAVARMTRICTEEGIRFSAQSGTTVAMGPQPSATALDVLDDCAKTDLGFLYQADFGLGYQPTDARTNATSAISIGFGQLGEPPEAADDDALYRNQWTVSRPNGISATVRNSEGVTYNGLYDDETVANVESDTTVDSQAGWRTNRDSIEVPRWPDLFINFANAGVRSLISTFSGLTFGPMATLTGAPSPSPPEDRLVFVEGVSGFFTPLDFTARLTNSPADAYRVAKYASDAGDLGAVGRYLSDGSTLRAAVTSGATSFDVDAGGGPWWTTAADDLTPNMRLRLFPARTELHGEEIDVSAVTDVAGSFVSVGAAVSGTGVGPATPGMPAGIAVGDTLFLVAVNRNIIPTVTAPVISSALWTLVADDSISNQPANMRVWARTYDGVFTAPGITFAGGATVDYQAQISAFRGLPLDATKVVLSYAANASASAADIAGAPMRPRHHRRLILAIGWRADDWTSVATYVATGTTFTEISEPSVTAGDDQGFVWDYAFQTTEVDVPAGSFVVTGGGAAATRSIVLLCDGGHQTLTASRGVGGTTATAHAQYDRVEVAQPLIPVLAAT